MTLFAGATQVQKAYIGASAVNAIMNAGVNVLGVNGSFPGITDSGLYLPLTHTLVPTRGSSTPTFARATAAWDFDSEGKLNINIPGGCVRFTGARFVRNRVATTSATLAVAATNTVTLARSETVTFSMGAGAGTATFSGTSGATGTLTASAGGRTEVTKTCTAGTFIITASVADLVDIQVEVVSGQADQTASEYVSVGVLASPYHGAGTVAGADGCKYFNTNKDGSAIPAATLKKYMAEPSRVNNCLLGRDIAGPTFTEMGFIQTPKAWVPSVTGASVVTNGTFDSDVSGWTKNGAGTLTWNAGVARVDGSSAATGGYQTLTLTIGKTYLITGDVTLVSGANPARVNIYSGITLSGAVKQQDLSANGSFALIFKATAVAQALYFSCVAGRIADFDNISVKECTCSPERIATGLDNVANSASLLTAAADDATIMQTLTASTGVRTFSGAFWPVTLTGTVSLTRNGGTNWTDITAQLVAGKYTFAALTADTGANATVGIKFSKAGDSVKFDAGQDENGAWRTSPILTTTAAVTRNADVLSYASAFNVAQGTALCQCRSEVPINSGSAVDILSTTGASILYLNSADERTVTRASDGTNSTSVTTGLNITTGIRKRVVRWGSDMRLCTDGSLGAAATFDGAMGSTSALSIGAGNITGNIGEVHIWNTPLTDAQMQTVTS